MALFEIKNLEPIGRQFGCVGFFDTVFSAREMNAPPTLVWSLRLSSSRKVRYSKMIVMIHVVELSEPYCIVSLVASLLLSILPRLALQQWTSLMEGRPVTRSDGDSSLLPANRGCNIDYPRIISTWSASSKRSSLVGGSGDRFGCVVRRPPGEIKVVGQFSIADGPWVESPL